MTTYKNAETLKANITKVKHYMYNSNSDYMSGYLAAIKSIEEALQLIPDADVTDVRHAVWVPRFLTYKDYIGMETEPIQSGWVCSSCGRYESRKEAYCHCGALMDNYK